MEEQKKTTGKGNQVKETPKKLTYEQLNDACNQLWQQVQSLRNRNKELEQFSMFKRLDYLFKVLEHSAMFSTEFVCSCTEEIQSAMTIEEAKEEQ